MRYYATNDDEARKIISLWGLKLVLEILVIIAGIFMLTRPIFALSLLWFICGFGYALLQMEFGLSLNGKYFR